MLAAVFFFLHSRIYHCVLENFSVLYMNMNYELDALDSNVDEIFFFFLLKQNGLSEENDWIGD